MRYLSIAEIVILCVILFVFKFTPHPCVCECVAINLEAEAEAETKYMYMFSLSLCVYIYSLLRAALADHTQLHYSTCPCVMFVILYAVIREATVLTDVPVAIRSRLHRAERWRLQRWRLYSDGTAMVTV